MATVIKNLNSRPSREEAQQLIAAFLDELYQLYSDRYGLDGSVENWYWMSFPPGAYAPANDGVVMDGTLFGRVPGTVRWAFGITDERPPDGSPWCLWVIKGDGHADVDTSPLRSNAKVKFEMANDDGEFPSDRLAETPAEHLVAVSQVDVHDPNDPDLGGRMDVRPVRKLSGEELARTHEAAHVLEHHFGVTPLAELAEAERDLSQAFDEVLAAQPRPAEHHVAARRLHRRFKAWLGAFKSFEDKTRHRISQELSDRPEEMAKCLAFFSEEFDANIAYRLAGQLRNVVEHQDQVLNTFTMSSKAMDGYFRYEVKVGIDLERIAQQDTSKRLNRKVATEMTNASGPVDARLLVSALQVACHRIHARIIHCSASEIREAADQVMAWHDEAQARGGHFACFLNEDALRAPLQSQMNLRGNPRHLADIAYADMLKSQRFDSVGPASVTIHNLIPLGVGVLEVPMTEPELRRFRSQAQTSVPPETQE